MPETVEVNGKPYAIRTDFHFWLAFSDVLERAEAGERVSYVDFMPLFADDIPDDIDAAFLACLQFYTPKNELPRDDGTGEHIDVLSYRIDADYIYAAFLEQYGIDLLTSDMHYYKFLALLGGLHDTKLNEIMGYRCYKKPRKSDTYEKTMQRMRDIWALPRRVTAAAKKKMDEFNALFSK